MIKRVVSFCLYGTSEHYRYGAIRNAELCKSLYPGWEVRFYVSPTIPEDVKEKLKELKAYVILVEAPDNAYFMNYRYLPCVDEDVELAVFRDTDSRVNVREVNAVNDWVLSGKSLHIMRDHPWHPPHPEQHMLLGGMWGVRCDKLRDLDVMAKQCMHDIVYGADQRFLTKYVYPRFAANGDIWVHDDIFDKKPFPTYRVWTNDPNTKELLPLFVGCQYDEHDNLRNLDHHRILKNYIESNG